MSLPFRPYTMSGADSRRRKVERLEIDIHELDVQIGWYVDDHQPLWPLIHGDQRPPTPQPDILFENIRIK